MHNDQQEQTNTHTQNKENYKTTAATHAHTRAWCGVNTLKQLLTCVIII